VIVMDQSRHGDSPIIMEQGLTHSTLAHAENRKRSLEKMGNDCTILECVPLVDNGDELIKMLFDTTVKLSESHKKLTEIQHVIGDK
jgi:hypothetical protein